MTPVYVYALLNRLLPIEIVVRVFSWYDWPRDVRIASSQMRLFADHGSVTHPTPMFLKMLDDQALRRSNLVANRRLVRETRRWGNVIVLMFETHTATLVEPDDEHADALMRTFDS